MESIAERTSTRHMRMHISIIAIIRKVFIVRRSPFPRSLHTAGLNMGVL
ncbi:MAG: hypothetical protein IIY37_05215 [Selenomonadaceae bacterium]|nr:hypothetical protein [Selenomonadaceae bacterium]